MERQRIAKEFHVRCISIKLLLGSKIQRQPGSSNFVIYKRMKQETNALTYPLPDCFHPDHHLLQLTKGHSAKKI